MVAVMKEPEADLEEVADTVLPHLRGVTLSAMDMDRALSEQSSKLFTAEALVETVIEALYQRYGRDWQIGVPDYPRVLRQAARLINDAYCNLEVTTLENNFAAALAKANEDAELDLELNQ